MKSKTRHLPSMLATVGAVLVGASAAYGQSATIEPIAGYTSSTFVDYQSIERPGGLVPVVVTFTKPDTTGQTTLGLRCRLTVPAGWAVDDGTYGGKGVHMTHSGTGAFDQGPVVWSDGTNIVYIGSFGTAAQQAAERTFSLHFSLRVPRGDAGQKSLRVRWGYYWSGMPSEAWLFAAKDPMLIADLNPATVPQAKAKD